MAQFRRTAIGALAALAVVTGSVIMPATPAAAKPNCLNLEVPCPPPKNDAAAGAEERVRSGDVQDLLLAAPGSPNCLRAPCPPPEDIGAPFQGVETSDASAAAVVDGWSISTGSPGWRCTARGGQAWLRQRR